MFFSIVCAMLIIRRLYTTKLNTNVLVNCLCVILSLIFACLLTYSLNDFCYIKWTEPYIVFILFVFSIHDANKQRENVDRMLYLRMYGTIPQGVGYSSLWVPHEFTTGVLWYNTSGIRGTNTTVSVWYFTTALLRLPLINSKKLWLLYGNTISLCWLKWQR